MFKKMIFPFLVLALLLSACSKEMITSVATQEAEAYAMEPGYNAPSPQVVEVEYVEAPREYDEMLADGGMAYAGNTAPDTVERIVIKNADLSIIVDDPTVVMERISLMAEEMGGYVVSANLYQTYTANGEKVPQASVYIRVPVERLNEALSRIKSETDQPVTREVISSQDVTAEYTDLDSRLTNLQATEAALVAIMADATETKDVLAVYAELSAIRGQIEVIQGQMKYYRESAALSGISVDLIANAAVQPLTIGKWQPVGVAKDAIQALIDAFKWLVEALIWIVLYILPVALVIFGPPILLIRYLLKKRKARKAAQQAE